MGDLPPGYSLRDGYETMDFEQVRRLLAATWWCPDTTREEVELGARHSALVIGAFDPAGRQVGYTRVVSDVIRFAYFTDVVVDEAHRGRGLGRAMVRYALDHPSMAAVKTWTLATSDAQGVYEPFGFQSVGNPSAWPVDWMVRRPDLVEQAWEPLVDGVVLGTFRMADYDEVVAFWHEQEGIGLSESDEREPMAAFLRRNPELSLVLRDGERVVGAVLCGHDGRRGYLHHLAVAPSHRGRGLGRRLVQTCLARLRAEGIAKCNVFLFANNAEGEAFWQALGYAHRSDLKVLQRATGSESG